MIFWIYVIIGGIWAQYALQNQQGVYGNNVKRDIKCILMNFLFWPVAMLFAYYKK